MEATFKHEHGSFRHTTDGPFHFFASGVFASAALFLTLSGSIPSLLGPGNEAGSTSTSKQYRKRQVRQNYDYTPLKKGSEFRLLELMPGRGDDPLVCNLHHFTLSHHSTPRTPSYEAISYVWGNSTPNQPISCNGKIFNITTSLKNALCRVRHPRNEIYVWADAICIDQSDIRERKMQVDLMRHIFARAKMVSICLGEGVDCSVENLSILNAIFWANITTRTQTSSELAPRNTSIFDTWLPGLSFKPSSQDSQASVAKQRISNDITSVQIQDPSGQVTKPAKTTRKLVLQKLVPHEWRLLAEFFDNPWFSRIWVVQEVAESKDARVLFGALEIPWSNIVDLAKTILRTASYQIAILPFAKTKGIHHVLLMNRKISVSSHDPIPILLQSTRDFGASDPRDKVYAMLHRPIRKPRTYIEGRFLQGWKYAEFFAKAVSVFYLSFMITGYTFADIHFWYLLLSLGMVAHHLQLYASICLLAFDFGERLKSFVYKLDRIVYSRFQITDTLCNMLGLEADYSLTAPSVYRMVATRLIERTRRLNILSYIDHGATMDVTYPSWVPRWDCPTGGVHVLTSFPCHGYRSSGNIAHTLPTSSGHADHLEVEGIRFCTISAVSETITSTQFLKSDNSQLTFGNVGAIPFHDQKGDNNYPTGESIRRAYIATLTAGRLGHIERKRVSYNPRELRSMVTAALRVCCGRRQFVTENGHIGIGPAAMQRGDIVCILFGGCVPYILRTTDTDGLYRIVGESYVHGIMQGEVIRGWRRGEFAKERFTLC